MNVTSVNGIGSSTEAALREHGIETVQQLAEMKVEELVKVPGFGAVRARQIIELAKEIVTSISEAPEPVAEQEESAKKKPKKKAKKKKKSENKSNKSKKDKYNKKDKTKKKDGGKGAKESKKKKKKKK